MDPTATVRQAVPADAEAFAACHLECWREAYGELWGEERLAEFDAGRMAVRRRKEIESGQANHVLAELDGEVIGIAIAGPSREDDAPTSTELYAIYVRSAHQGSGIANGLLTAAIGEGPALLLGLSRQPAGVGVLRQPRLHSQRGREDRLPGHSRDQNGPSLSLRHTQTAPPGCRSDAGRDDDPPRQHRRDRRAGMLER